MQTQLMGETKRDGTDRKTENAVQLQALTAKKEKDRSDTTIDTEIQVLSLH